MDPVTGTMPARQNPPARSALASDFDTFLRMLTTQMQNQDPLNPLESTDFAVQLATFSGVEQQVRTNTLLSSLATRFDLVGMAQMSGLVGQEALVTAPVHFDGSPVTIRPEVARNADSAVLTVRDAAGNLVSRETIPLGDAPYRWLGGDASGNPLPQGLYTLAIESQRDGQVTGTSPAPAYARITEVRRDGDGLILQLQGGVQVPADQVRGFRAP